MKTLFLSLAILNTALCIYSFDIRFNITSSIQKGAYKLTKDNTDISKGNIILFCLKDKYSVIAKERKYLSQGKCANNLSPIGKHVIASYKDKVRITTEGIYVNGIHIKNTRPLSHDIEGRELSNAEIDKILDQDEFIVASTKIDSFDSRYYGIVKRKEILGKLQELLLI